MNALHKLNSLEIRNSISNLAQESSNLENK